MAAVWPPADPAAELPVGGGLETGDDSAGLTAVDAAVSLTAVETPVGGGATPVFAHCWADSGLFCPPRTASSWKQ